MARPQPIVSGPVSDFLASVALAPRQDTEKRRTAMRRIRLATAFALGLAAPAAAQTRLGKLSANRYAPDSSANAYGAGSPFRADSRSNLYGAGRRSVGE